MAPFIIRQEQADDIAAIYRLNCAAFDTAAEAELVDRLREAADPFLSLLAEQDDQLIGHLLLTPVTLDSNPELRLMGLAPMAVLPEQQRRGVGRALIEAGLACCRDLNIGAVVVLGHPDYYPRFGFAPSADYGIDSDYDVPAEAFMLQELIPAYLGGQQGRIHYHPVFAGL